MVWQNNQISPFSVGVDVVINLLIIAVVGGLGHPIGAFIGAIIYVILRTFALDALVAVGLDGRRFQTLIGLGFLVIVLFSPDGVIGLWRRMVGARAVQPRREQQQVSSIAERMAAAGTGNAIELRGVSRLVRRAGGVDRHHAERPAGRAARRARIERRRQDDAAQLRDRRFSADFGNRAFLRRGCDDAAAARAHSPRAAPHLPDLVAVLAPDRARERLSRLPRRLARSLFLHPHQRARRDHAIGQRSHLARAS